MRSVFKNFFHIVIASICVMSSCVKGDSIQSPAKDPPLFSSPSEFNYETAKDVGIDIKLLTNNDEPLANVLVNILDKRSEDGGSIMYTALTNNSGRILASLKIPTYMTSVVVDPCYIGVMRNAVVKVENQTVLCTLGGKNGFDGNVEAERQMPHGPALTTVGGRGQSLYYQYMGTYDSWGKPNYLQTNNDVISSTLLSYVNASLPEQKPVPAYHPAYLNSNAKTNLDMVQDGDVYITFVHEGAGYTNALAYFTYPTNQAPNTPGAIDTLHMIFPNASLRGSSGNLTSGNKVKLGRFKANTSIGFCLVSNGWNNTTHLVGGGNGNFFSIDALNPESAAVNKRHAVLLNDNTNNLFLIGMEDINRENGSDHDFNDIVFYATSVNSAQAISRTNMNPIDKPGDRDNDGVSDVYDQFPTDPARAYINWYPSATTFGSVAFEDTWPHTGDYDMNDLIVQYRYKTINNAQNNTVEMYADYALEAAGATFNSGFGIQFPFGPSVISSVTGTRLQSSYPVSLNNNGTESGQSKAVVIPFNNFFSIMPPSAPGNTVNTQPGITTSKPDSIHLKVSFTSPITAATLGNAPFNQFTFMTESRGKEIHLPGERPTDKVNSSLFNTQQDNTIPNLNRYYKTVTNLPFGINIPQKFDYPIEGKAINTIYYKFEQWAQSGGTLYPDWYVNKPGYRSSNWFYK